MVTSFYYLNNSAIENLSTFVYTCLDCIVVFDMGIICHIVSKDNINNDQNSSVKQFNSYNFDITNAVIHIKTIKDRLRSKELLINKNPNIIIGVTHDVIYTFIFRYTV